MKHHRKAISSEKETSSGGGFDPLSARAVPPGAPLRSWGRQAEAVPGPRSTPTTAPTRRFASRKRESPRHATQARGAKPSGFDRFVGVTDLFFGAFLFLAHFAVPITGRHALGSTIAPAPAEPNLVLLFLATLILLAGFEKWTGRQEWWRGLTARVAPRSRGDPLAYTLLVVLFWLFWKAFMYGAALVAPFYVAVFWLNATGRI